MRTPCGHAGCRIDCEEIPACLIMPASGASERIDAGVVPHMTQEPLWAAIRTFLARWKSWLPIPLAIAFLAAVITSVLPTQWSSKAVLEFPSMPSAVDFVAAEQASADASGGAGGGMLAKITGSNNRLERYLAILKSQRFREAVADEVPLSNLLGLPSRTSVIKLLEKQMKFRIVPGEVITVETSLPAANLIQRQLLGTPTKAIQDATVQVVNCYVEQLKTYLDTVSASHERSEREYIEPQVAQIKEELLDLQRRQLTQLQQGPAVPPKDERPLVVDSLGKLEQARSDTLVQLTAAQREVLTTHAQLTSAPMMVQAGLQKAKNPEIDRLQAMLTDAQARLYVMRNTEGKSDKHPDVRRELEGISQVEAKLKAALDEPLQTSQEQVTRSTTYDALKQGYSLAVVKATSLQSQLKALDGLRMAGLQKMHHLAPREVQQLKLEAEYAEKYETYTLLRKALTEAQIREQYNASVFVVLDAPEAPLVKSGPCTSKNILIGFCLGIFLNILLGELRRSARVAHEARAQLAEQ